MPATAKDIDVFGHLGALLRGEESVDAFIDWFWPAYFAIDAHGTDLEYEMSTSIENWLYQYSGEYIDIAEFLDGLRQDTEELGVEWRAVAEMPGAPRLAS